MPTAEAWAQIRADYEHTSRPIEEICAEHGISSGTLRDRMRRWGWARRRQPIPAEGPPPLAARRFDPPFRPAPTPLVVAPAAARPGPDRGILPAAPEPTRIAAPSEPAPVPVEASPAQIAQRLQGAVARVLPAIETTLAKLAAGPSRPHEMEHTTRALGALTRALRELNALVGQYPQGSALDDDDDMPEDIDAFRNELARRINAFCDARGAEARNRGGPDDT